MVESMKMQIATVLQRADARLSYLVTHLLPEFDYTKANPQEMSLAEKIAYEPITDLHLKVRKHAREATTEDWNVLFVKADLHETLNEAVALLAMQTESAVRCGHQDVAKNLLEDVITLQETRDLVKEVVD